MIYFRSEETIHMLTYHAQTINNLAMIVKGQSRDSISSVLWWSDNVVHRYVRILEPVQPLKSFIGAQLVHPPIDGNLVK